jgi:hypothetical protein
MRQGSNGSKGPVKLQVPIEWEQEQRAKNIPKRILEMIEFWNTLGAVPFEMNKNGTKVFWNTIESLRKLVAGSLYDSKPGLTPWSGHKFSVDDFKLSVKRFHRAMALTDYKPPLKEPLRKRTLQAFLYTPGGTVNSRSYFLTYYENPPEPRVPLPEEKEPLITNRLIHHYKTNVLGDTDCEILPHEMKLFIQSANRLHEFFHSNKSKIMGGFKMPHSLKMADYLWESMQMQYKEILHKITPGWFVSEKVFTGPFRRYLHKESILNKSIPKGPKIGQSFTECDAKIPPELQS